MTDQEIDDAIEASGDKVADVIRWMRRRIDELRMESRSFEIQADDAQEALSDSEQYVRELERERKQPNLLTNRGCHLSRMR